MTAAPESERRHKSTRMQVIRHQRIRADSYPQCCDSGLDAQEEVFEGLPNLARAGRPVSANQRSQASGRVALWMSGRANIASTDGFRAKTGLQTGPTNSSTIGSAHVSGGHSKVIPSDGEVDSIALKSHGPARGQDMDEQTGASTEESRQPGNEPALCQRGLTRHDNRHRSTNRSKRRDCVAHPGKGVHGGVRSVRPAGVRRTRRLRRSKSKTPRSSSNWRT